jgi:hypothetical protein
MKGWQQYFLRIDKTFEQNVFAPSVDFFLYCPIHTRDMGTWYNHPADRDMGTWYNHPADRDMGTWYNHPADLEACITPSDLHQSSSHELCILSFWGPVQDSHNFLVKRAEWPTVNEAQLLPLCKRTAFKLLLEESMKSRHSFTLYSTPNFCINPGLLHQYIKVTILWKVTCKLLFLVSVALYNCSCCQQILSFQSGA